jgi:general secretion pathway protein A
MYHQHFGLSGPPFQFTPTPDALYLSKTHREALAALEWGLLREPTGFTLLVGESGVGKTTLVCSILTRRYENVRAAFITNPRLNFEQMMQVALSQLVPGAGGRNKFELTESFVRLLDDLAPGERVALIIDESQELSEETLEELRLLSNTDTAAERRLQLIFVGQPELMEQLASSRMRSLNQRIGARALLKPLAPAEVREYIDCRLRAKGGAARRIFASAALNHLMAHSRGIPRRINVLCHNSMLLGYAAGSKKVTLAMARSAVSEYEDLIGANSEHQNLVGARRARSAAAEPACAGVPLGRWVARAALAVTALALAVLGAVYLWSAQTLLASSPLHPSVAIRPAAGPKTTGPGVLLRPVAPAARASAPLAVDFSISAVPVSAGPPAAALPHAPGAPCREALPCPGAPTANATPRRAATAGEVGRKALANDGDSTAPSKPSAVALETASNSAPRPPTGTTPADAAQTGAARPTDATPPGEKSGSASVSARLRSIRVRYGDTLLKIATRYLGSPEGLNQLLDANPQLEDIDRIYPGETVYLPPMPAVVAR